MARRGQAVTTAAPLVHSGSRSAMFDHPPPFAPAMPTLIAVLMSVALAAPPGDQIARLGKDLTPIGAEQAGSDDGRIPAWEGGIVRAPDGYRIGDRHPDPYAADARLYTIDASNVAEHAERLSVGQQALLARYPDSYRMHVYPTRRSASFPRRIYERTMANAATGRLVSDGDGVADVAEGFPFPLPTRGEELIWNHKLKYKGVSQTRANHHAVPTVGGRYELIRNREELLGVYWREGATLADTRGILTYYFQAIESPPSLAGNILLVHETLDQSQTPRQAWIYNPGQRRVRKAPNVAYDNSNTASDSQSTFDMTDMFNGALDRYNWTLVGKRELYVPYNSYRAHSGELKVADLVKAGHLNPEPMRYERHRVWIVDAVLKAGVRHIKARRTFYLDEDSYQILLIEHYDTSGRLWRVSEAHPINYYEVPTFWTTLEAHYDLLNGRYIAYGLDNEVAPNNFSFTSQPENFTPAALRTRGTR